MFARIFVTRITKMYPAGQHPMYPYTMEEKELVLRDTGLKESQLQEYTDIVLDWFQKQPHLAEAGIKREIIERTILTSKGSLEKTKQRIDSFYRHRALAPELIQERITILNDPNIDLWEYNSLTPMPKLYNGRRITVSTLVTPETTHNSTEKAFITSLMIGDIRFVNDFMLGDIWIVDLKQGTMTTLMKMNWAVVTKASKMIQEGTGLRIHSIHLINCSVVTIAQLLLNMLQNVLSQKVLGRVKFHNSVEELYEFIPKEYLPEDYGGEQPSIDCIKEKFENVIRSDRTKQFLIDACKMVSDESKRPKGDSEDCLYGTFKKLELD